MQCKGKKTFSSRRSAERILNIIWKTSFNQTHTRPCRAYKCKECGKWHLTSKPLLVPGQPT